MERSIQDRIFEPFFTTKGVKGTGLGLAMAHGTIQQSGGHIRVYSEPGEGTSFRIYFPAVDRPPDPPAPADRASGELRGVETILLVEDEPALLTLAARMLRGYGYEVLEANTGAAALKISQEYAGPIPLLITDSVLPDMKGREVAAIISSRRADIRILSISGYAEERATRKTDPPVLRAFLQKPFRAETLAAAVRELLDRGQPTVPARILIVDDDAGLRETLARMIARPGWELLQAEDGDEALAILARQPVDIVISDLMMPDCDGVELVRAVRKNHPRLKILMMSGQNNDCLLKATGFLGANGVLIKPIKREALVGAVRALLTRSADAS